MCHFRLLLGDNSLSESVLVLQRHQQLETRQLLLTVAWVDINTSSGRRSSGTR